MHIASLILETATISGFLLHLVVQLSDHLIALLDLGGCASRTQQRLHLDEELPPWVLTKIKIHLEVALNDASCLRAIETLVGYPPLREASGDSLESIRDLEIRLVKVVFRFSIHL